MATDYTYARIPKRYLIVGEVVHRLYETEDGHHRTQCGVITQEGEVVRSKNAPRCGRLCRACCEAFARRPDVLECIGEKSPVSPTKTTGRKRRGSVSGTTQW